MRADDVIVPPGPRDAEGIARTGTQPAAGARARCPYCLFSIDGQTTTCPVCRSSHHGECWQHNGGCSVMGCGAAPGSATSASLAPAHVASPARAPQWVGAAPAPAMSSDSRTGGRTSSPPLAPMASALDAPPTVPSPPGYLSPPPSPARGRNRPLQAALVLLAVVVAGSVIALVSASPGPSEEDRAVAAYRSDARVALEDFSTLDDKLDDGVQYYEYQILFDRAQASFEDLRTATPVNLRGEDSYIAISDAFDAYQTAMTEWGTWFDCSYYCGDSPDDSLQTSWSTASDAVTRAESDLAAAE